MKYPRVPLTELDCTCSGLCLNPHCSWCHLTLSQHRHLTSKVQLGHISYNVSPDPPRENKTSVFYLSSFALRKLLPGLTVPCAPQGQSFPKALMDVLLLPCAWQGPHLCAVPEALNDPQWTPTGEKEPAGEQPRGCVFRTIRSLTWK